MNLRTDEEKELYQNVRSKLNQNIKDYVTNLIRKTKFSLDDETVNTDHIVEDVSKLACESDVYQKLRRSFLMDIVKQNKITFSHKTKEDHCEWETNQNHSSASVNSSLSSSLNQCGYLIVDIKDIQNAERLLNDSLIKSKLQALNILNRISSLDQLISQSIWVSLESALRNTLLHPVSIVNELCLNVYIKMLRCSSPLVVNESYNSLLQFLSLNCNEEENQEMQNIYFLSKKQIFLQVFVIINRFQQYIIRSWLRYPQHIIESMINDMFEHILQSLTKQEKNYNFVKFVVIVDPEVNWLKNWLHSNLSRQFVFNAIKEREKIINWILNNLEEFNEKVNNYELYFSIYFIGRLLQYSQGCKLISNIYLDISFDSVITKIWNSLIKCAWKFYKVDDDFLNSAMNVLSKTLYYLWENEIFKWHINDRINVLQELIFPIDKFKSIEFSDTIFYINHLTKLVSNISIIDSVRKDLMNEQLNMHKQLNHIFDYLKEFDLKDENLQIFCDEILINILKIYKDILSVPQGILWANLNSLVPVLIQILQNLLRENGNKTPTPSCSSDNISEISEKNKATNIFQTVYTLMSSPLGVVLVTDSDFLIESFDILIENYLDIYNSHILENCNCYKACLFLFAYYPSNKQLLQNLLLTFPKRIWQLSNDCDNENCFDTDQSVFDIFTINHLKILMFTHSNFKMFYIDEFSKIDNLDAFKIWKSICLFPYDGIIYKDDNIHIISLYVLTSLICNIKTCLFLQQKLDIGNFLIDLLNCHTSSDGSIIIDEYSLLWNHILVRLYVIGGPSEKKIPPKKLSTLNYNWPLVKKDSIYKDYWIFVPENHLINQSSLSCIQVMDRDKLNLYKNFFINHLKTEGNISLQQISLLLEEIVKYLPSANFNIDFECRSSLSDISDDEKFGAQLAEHYGNNLNLFNSIHNEQNLESILKSCKLSINNIECEEFDIFVATIFLLLKGNQNACCTFLKQYIQTQACIYNWILPCETALKHDKKLQLLHAMLSQHFEVIVEETIPTVFSAFKRSGIPPSMIFWNWTNQYFWNYLDWIDICNWILLTMFDGDFIIYFSVAIFKHLEQNILKYTQENMLLDYLKENSISDFKVYDYIMFILELSERYHYNIKENIYNILKI